MDVRDITNVFVAKNCARTASGANETIDGLVVPAGSVQASVTKDDAGAASLSYYGNGELLITDASGLALDATTALKAVPQISFKIRSYDGKNHISSKILKGKNIESYAFTPYAAPVEQVTVMSAIDNSLTDHSYMIKIRKLGSDVNKLKEPTVKTAYFKSSTAGNTAEEIIDGLVDYINKNFNTDTILPITASKAGSNDALILEALPLNYEVGKEKYEKLRFEVILVNFDATLENNMYSTFTYNAVNYAQATKGAGNYEQVADMEYFAIMYSGANRDKLSPLFKRNVVNLSTQEFEDDGTTKNRYDTIVINWENAQGDISHSVAQKGSIAIFLPLDDNTTNQQADVLATLNKYIVTEYGVGSAITLS